MITDNTTHGEVTSRPSLVSSAVTFTRDFRQNLLLFLRQVPIVHSKKEILTEFLFPCLLCCFFYRYFANEKKMKILRVLILNSRKLLRLKFL